MEPVRPIPLRPSRNPNDSRPVSADTPPASRSSVEKGSLSRSSSFLNFTGLETLKSSALFGIFEQGGYKTAPPTPDISKVHEFPLADRPSPIDPNEVKARMMIAGAKLLGIGLAAFTIISLFNRLPKHNQFCVITAEAGAQALDPFFYAITASAIALVFSFADRSMMDIIPADRDIERPVTRPNSVTNLPSRASREGERGIRNQPFSVLLRYFTGLLSLAYAGSKLDFSQPSQFNICVAAIAVCAIGVLDRTVRGLILSLAISAVLSSTLVLIKGLDSSDSLSVFLLVWLNVVVYGNLGKILQVAEHPYWKRAE